MMNEEQAIMAQAEAAIVAQQAQAGSLNSQTMAQSSMIEQQEYGLAEKQLDLSQEKERLEHFFRGEILKTDEQGNQYWKEPADARLVLLNDYGINKVMLLLDAYLTKIKLLSNYSEEVINEKMEDIATMVCDEIFMEYREVGLDTDSKKKNFELIVRIIQDTIHDVYLRALNGKERDSIRKHMNIQENLGASNEGGGAKLNPMNWLRR